MKYGLRIFLLGLMLSAGGCSQTGLAIINGLSLAGDYQRLTDIPYGDAELNELDIYLPTAARQSRPLPVVLFFYGGCWGGCKTYTREYYRFVGEALASQGFIAVLADYRRYPDVLFPEIMDDAAAAARWTIDNIDKHGGNKANVFVMGHSAGAHLAVMLALDERYLDQTYRSSLTGFIGLAGPYDFLPLDQPYQFELFGPEEKYPDSQPINFIDSNDPPLLLLWGEQDEAVYAHNLENLAAKAEQLNARVETQRYPELDHIGILTALAKPMRRFRPVLADITRYIHTQTN